ncbi:Putative plasmid replication protein [Corynebacterium xerosis]|nr:Putative plasmid replication protein [Corynebacterium xerosis]
MTIPSSPDSGGGDTPSVFPTAQPPSSSRPWDDLEPGPRPSQWTDPSTGQAIHSYSPDLFAAPSAPGIRSCGWNDMQAMTFLQHLGRDAFQASRDRDFSKAWKKNPETGETKPRMFPVGTPALERCQYAVLTHPQYTAALVLDIDRPSHESGGQVTNLHSKVHTVLDRLAVAGYGPAWLGINPLNGKAQAIWLIDPVYAGEGRSSPNTRLLTIATTELNQLLGGDLAFSHRFSRWPLHKSSDPTAYRWHCQHNQIVRLTDLVAEVRRMTNTQTPGRGEGEKQYPSGRDRIEAARKATAEAKMLRELAEQLPETSQIAPAAAGVIDGVRVMWISTGRAARDETAFRHALATAHRLKKAGEALKDAKLIDAYERGYNVAQAVGGDGREPDMPPMRDRLTMARRVRGYVTAGVTNPTTRTGGATRMSSAGRKALATLGRRGGQRAAERWKDPESEYAQQQRTNLAAANQKREWQGTALRAQVQSSILSMRVQTGRDPSTKELAGEYGVSERRIRQLRRELGLTAKPGRPTKRETP